MNVNSEKDLYKKGKLYWEDVSPNIAGMLGGWTNVNTADVDESRKILRNLLKSMDKDKMDRPLRALDCGSGIGRVTKYVLSKFFDEIDLLEQNEKFVQKSKEYLGNDYNKIKHTFIQGIQNFEPLENSIYDCIWAQWVMGYLTDEDFVIFLQKCSRILDKNHGFIVIKDNVTKSTDDCVDEEDGSITRSEYSFLKIFAKVNDLQVTQVLKQRKLPKELYPVKIFILKHRSDPVQEVIFDK